MSKKDFALGVRLLLLGLLVSVAGFAQSPSGITIPNLSYSSGPGTDERFYKLDLYLPEGKANVPLLFFVHGGGFTRGDKIPDGFNNFVDFFLREGIGVASANYRLAPAVKQSEQVQDVAKAYAWVVANAAKYKIDASRIFLAGHSAGGYLASSVALNSKYLEAQGISLKSIRGAIGISGVYDPLPSATSLTPAYESAARLVGTNRDIPPFLITYTDRDYYGMAEQGRRLYSLFLKYNLPVQMAVVTDRTHIVQIAGVGRALPKVPDPGTIQESGTPATIEDTLGPAILRFINDVLQGRPMANILLKAAAPPVRTVKDVAYVSGAGADPKFHVMDLYLPEGKTNFPLVFFIHGGGWRQNDKVDPTFNAYVETFAKIGMGVASANYRLSPAVKHPAHIQDVAKAFAWLYNNAAKYGVDRNRIVVAGHSAGGHLAALLALHPEYLKKEGLPPGAIRGVLAQNGIYDVQTFAEPGVIPTRVDDSFPADLEIRSGASPMRYVTAQAPPFLIVYAESDLFNIREQSIRFYSEFVKKGARAELAHIPGRTHSGTRAGMGQAIDQVDDLMAPSAVQFVTRIFQTK